MTPPDADTIEIADDDDGEDMTLMQAVENLVKEKPHLSLSQRLADPETLYVTRGPFHFKPDCKYQTFLNLMSDALPCPPANIVLDKTQWKPQTPANRALLPLGGSVGFDVLLKQMSWSNDKTFWDVKGDDGVTGGVGEAGPLNVAGNEEKAFDFSQLESTNTEDSVGEQKVSFNKAIASHLEELKKKWPVNKAGQRIYTDEKGFKWELTSIRLNVWAAHKTRGSATLDKPPVSAQFDIKNRIKTQPTPPTPFPAQPLATPGVAPAPSATDQLIAMALTMLQQQQHQHHPQYLPVVPAPPIQPPVHPNPEISPVPSAPQLPAKPAHRPVSLLEFSTY
ncbi:hypothetical protein B0H16DRAFT_1684789 [Mycena metata]|uniref:Uncharacterized protein n=1 Tax=Mycena metata TaxID=1033252 RepID=A0AAD7NT51_9AGAR|nr:hypothetical protein B0H16DRAFT_1684789 [Mycena metata]